MVKMLNKIMATVIVSALALPAFMVQATEEPIIFKVALTDAPTIKVGDTQVFHPSWAAMLAFQNGMAKYSRGKVKVELYANGRLGDSKSNIEQILSGNLGAATPADGAIAPFYKPIQLMSTPYVFKDSLQAYDLMDGPFGQKLFDDMAAKSGLRVLSAFENGGFRGFTNNKKVVRVPEDLKGMKIRTMDSPVYMEIVRAAGGSPTPIAWMELYSALQTGVVDGEENSPMTLLAGSLQEVQKFYTLNNHTMGTAYIVASEKFFKSLSPELQEAFLKAGREGSIAGRGLVRASESIAMDTLRKAGVDIYVPNPEEMKLWQKTDEKAIEWMKTNIDKALVEELISSAKAGQQAKAVASSSDGKATSASSTSYTLYVIIGAIVFLLGLFAIFGKKKNKAQL